LLVTTVVAVAVAVGFMGVVVVVVVVGHGGGERLAIGPTIKPTVLAPEAPNNRNPRTHTMAKSSICCDKRSKGSKSEKNGRHNAEQMATAGSI
jgi:hypothetical protein